MPSPVPGTELDSDLSRRDFLRSLGVGLLVSVAVPSTIGQGREGRNRGGVGTIAARLWIGEDGTFTVLTGKIEMGQGARAEVTQAAAEELHVAPAQILAVMGDTALVPDDGLTAGSRTTPQTLPAVRAAAAAARELLVRLAAARWGVEPTRLQVQEGRISDSSSGKTLAYADLARSGEAAAAFREAIPPGVEVTPAASWKVMGTSVARPNRFDLVTGAHRYPSDYTRPGMLYGKVLRPPSFGATLQALEVVPAQAVEGVTVVRDGEFVGVVAPTTFLANRALQLLMEHAAWTPASHPASRELPEYLRQHAEGGDRSSPFPETIAAASRVLRRSYFVPYVQHAPMETRTALAEWVAGGLTVWTGTQNPFGYRSELARAFGLPADRVRVVVPDFGCGFGGKHTAEAAVEAARLAKAAGKPVLLRWTREEEFTWASFRPAAVIAAEATLDPQGRLTSWHFVDINGGAAAVESPYRAGQSRSRAVNSRPPLRHGSYRGLAATANNFARECFMDELAAAANRDPLEFRLAHLENARLRAVLKEAAGRFRWGERLADRTPGVGVGLACGTEKGSYVAACVEVEVDSGAGHIAVRRVGEVFECGAVVNPENLLAQAQSCILMGLGPALREEIRFVNGKLANASFSKYAVPRFEDVPELDVHLLDRKDLPSAGGGETPLIAIAPAIANAVFHATGRRARRLPVRVEDLEEA